MRLIGMLDSPYVRRVAISLSVLELPFEHEPLSVFRDVVRFRRLNPVLRAPTLVCDEGDVLMDSTLILEYAEALAAPRSLMPASLPERRRALQLIGLALAACEKTVALIYERDHRPPAKAHAPWIARVTDQLLAAYQLLDAQLSRVPIACDSSITQAGITIAVSWRFTQMTMPDVVDAAGVPAIADLSLKAEESPAFRAAPYGTGAVTVGDVKSAGTREAG